MSNCLFCKIVAREIPAEIVYDNEIVMAFLDITPVNPGHVLVIPKAHYPDFASTPPETLCEVTVVAQHMAKAALAATGATGFNIGVNNGRVAGQLVDHMHLHVMPRRDGDGYDLWHGMPYATGQMAVVAEKIRAAL